jgi:hypothetical protein
MGPLQCPKYTWPSLDHSLYQTHPFPMRIEEWMSLEHFDEFVVIAQIPFLHLPWES